MTITIKLDNINQIELYRVANELHVAPQSLIESLKNIYLANLNDDLSWIAEMRQEDKTDKITN